MDITRPLHVEYEEVKLDGRIVYLPKFLPNEGWDRNVDVSTEPKRILVRHPTTRKIIVYERKDLTMTSKKKD